MMLRACAPSVSREQFEQFGGAVACVRIHDIRLSTEAKEYAWVNSRQIWSVAIASLATRKIHASAFMQ